MSAPTIAVEWLLARAAMRTTGLLHIVSRRDSGALNPICGARTISSEKIETQTRLHDIATLCPGCATIAASIGGAIPDGVALLLGLTTIGSTTRLLEVPIDEIRARDDHARQTPGDDLDSLVDSITERGVVTPLILRRQGNRFEIIDGARRLHAAAVAGLATVPAVVRDATDRDVLLDALVANLHRTDLNPIDQAHAYVHAIETLGLPSKAELGRLLGISREQISNTIRLLALPEAEQQRLIDGDLTVEGGRALLRAKTTPDPQLAAIADMLTQALKATVAVRTRGATTEFVLSVPTAERDHWLAQLTPAA